MLDTPPNTLMAKLKGALRHVQFNSSKGLKEMRESLLLSRTWCVSYPFDAANIPDVACTNVPCFPYLPLALPRFVL